MTDVVSSLRQVQDGILAFLQSHFAGRVTTIEPFRITEETAPTLVVDTPAILLDIGVMEFGEHLGDDRAPIDIPWVAYCILSAAETPDVYLEGREFAVEVMRSLYGNHFGLNAALSAPREIMSGPATFKAGSDGYEVDYVSFVHTAFLGESIWSPTVTPTKVWLGIQPNTGPDHIDDYIQISSEANLPEF